MMNKRLKRVLIGLTAAMLATVCLLGAVGTAAEPNVNLFDFRSTEDATATVRKPSELFEGAFGFKPSDAEITYLDGESGISFRYTDALPIDLVQTVYDRDTETLTVTATNYTYTAQNGTAVVWEPKSVTISGKSATFTKSGDGYTCLVREIKQSGDFDMDVSFTCKLTLSADAAEILLNAAWREGEAKLPTKEAYDALVKEYDDAMDRYLAYEAYEQLKRDYAVYQQELAIYNEWKLYRDWQAYFAYQTFITESIESYNNYLKYLRELEQVKKCLSVIENLYTSDSRNYNFYASFMGGTVDQVISRKAELVAFDPSLASWIDQADAATKALRPLLTGYNQVRSQKYASEHARLSAIYGYYSANYSEINRQFQLLHAALDKLSNNMTVQPAIKLKLKMEGKYERYQQFIGLLYITATCMDDNVGYYNNWTIFGLSLDQAVEEKHRLGDFAADPVNAPMPSVEVPKVEAIPEAPRPAGNPVYKAPNSVEIAEKPTEVQNPATLPQPPYAEKPQGARPVSPLSNAVSALAGMVKDGTLTKRSLGNGPFTLARSATVTRRVSVDNKKVIVFYDTDRKTVLDQQMVAWGEPIRYQGARDITKPWQDHYNNYVFLYWADAEGNNPALVADKDLALYAKCKITTRTYTVNWVVDDCGTKREKTESNYLYGAMPILPIPLTVDKGYDYTLTWNREISQVTGDVTYVGTRTRTPKSYQITFLLPDGGTLVEMHPWGSIPKPFGGEDYVSATHYYDHKSWERLDANGKKIGNALIAVQGDAIYRGIYTEKPLAVSANQTPYAITVTDTDITVHCTEHRVIFNTAAELAIETNRSLTLSWGRFAFRFSSAELQKLVEEKGYTQIDLDFKAETAARAELALRFRTLQNVLVSSADVNYTFLGGPDAAGNETLAYVKNIEGAWQEIATDGVEFGRTKSFCVISISPLTFKITGDGVPNLSEIPTVLKPGELVDFSSVACTFGYEITAIRAVAADGSTVTVNGLTMIMPEAAVEIELVLERIVYHVVFMSAGTVIFEKNYFMGEEIVFPADPTRPADDRYVYSFKGWSNDQTLAIGADREIVFEAEYLTHDSVNYDPRAGQKISITVILMIVLLLVGVGLIVFLSIRRKRKKAQRLAPTRTKAAHERAKAVRKSASSPKK